MCGYHRNQLLDYVRQHPGQTAGEIARGSGVDRFEASRRLPELRRAGLLRNGDKRKCSALGNLSLTWRPA
jgi:DNA-binding IclR family transcriptional regulator